MGFRYGSDNHFREITFTDCNNINHVEINVRTNTGYYDQTKLLDIGFDLEIYVPPVNKGEQCTSDSNCADGDCIGGICCSGNYPGALSCEAGTGYYRGNPTSCKPDRVHKSNNWNCSKFSPTVSPTTIPASKTVIYTKNSNDGWCPQSAGNNEVHILKSFNNSKLV